MVSRAHSTNTALNVRKYRVSRCRGADKHTHHTHTQKRQHVATLYPPPEQFTCRRLSAPPFTASPSPLLPPRIDVSSLDFIDQTSGAKWSRHAPPHLSSRTFSRTLQPPCLEPLWSSVWVNTGLKAAAGSFTKCHKTWP